VVDGEQYEVDLLVYATGFEAELTPLFRRAGHDIVGRDGNSLVVHVDGSRVDDVAARVNRAAFDAGITLVELSPLRTSLEDRYLALVNGGGPE
jgi:hypothetical protein